MRALPFCPLLYPCHTAAPSLFLPPIADPADALGVAAALRLVAEMHGLARRGLLELPDILVPVVVERERDMVLRDQDQAQRPGHRGPRRSLDPARMSPEEPPEEDIEGGYRKEAGEHPRVDEVPLALEPVDEHALEDGEPPQEIVVDRGLLHNPVAPLILTSI